MLRHLSLTTALWSFGTYLVVWVALSISILHMLEVDYVSTFLAPAPTPTKLSYHQRRNISVDEAFLELYNYSSCFRLVDYGIVDAIQSKVVCAPGGADGTSITALPADELWTDGSVWRNFGLDLRNAEALAPIADPSEDGQNHDPRFKYTPGRVMCAQCAHHGSPTPLLAHVFPQNANDSTPMTWRCDHREHGVYDTRFEEPVVLVARKDDHNPFFLLSAAFDAWIVVTKQLRWQPSARVVFLDTGVAMPYDTIFQKLLGPARPVVYGSDLLGKRVGFDNAVFVPFEQFGPLMQHLNDDQPCLESYLVRDFRDAVLAAFDMPRAAHPLVHRPGATCLVTIISRRPIRGRAVNRMWANEEDILLSMIDKYGSDCTFQSVDFAELTAAEQIATVAASRVLIGMHGAGLANVLFAAPHTFVIEIFPIMTDRFGFRNICQYLGLEYVAFRDGMDTIWPTQHKTIAMDEWFRVFDLVMDVVLTPATKKAFEERKVVQRQIHRQHVLATEFHDA
ncbi:hypothetical protein ACHHYP_08652 [Achlya hypogyna]|uniref:Glycosyltransferase 61 catalytic domain-containing protein n=1 Tax=Achlya hypogyna TaxID=1202772 RepID=A0A1V9ZKC1_ACHHY|nr:hypothetical protein ACHHYP_08652 [Achlya hypogyna]